MCVWAAQSWTSDCNDHTVHANRTSHGMNFMKPWALRPVAYPARLPPGELHMRREGGRSWDCDSARGDFAGWLGSCGRGVAVPAAVRLPTTPPSIEPLNQFARESRSCCFFESGDYASVFERSLDVLDNYWRIRSTPTATHAKIAPRVSLRFGSPDLRGRGAPGNRPRQARYRQRWPDRRRGRGRSGRLRQQRQRQYRRVAWRLDTFTTMYTDTGGAPHLTTRLNSNPLLASEDGDRHGRSHTRRRCINLTRRSIRSTRLRLQQKSGQSHCLSKPATRNHIVRPGGGRYHHGAGQPQHAALRPRRRNAHPACMLHGGEKNRTYNLFSERGRLARHQSDGWHPAAR